MNRFGHHVRQDLPQDWLWKDKVSCPADSAFHLSGIVTRSQLLRLLKHRIGFFRHRHGKLPSSRAGIPATQAGLC